MITALLCRIKGHDWVALFTIWNGGPTLPVACRRCNTSTTRRVP